MKKERGSAVEQERVKGEFSVCGLSSEPDLRGKPFYFLSRTDHFFMKNEYRRKAEAVFSRQGWLNAEKQEV